MLDLQFGRHPWRAAIAAACQVMAVAALAGCEKAPAAKEAPPASAPQANAPQEVDASAVGSSAPSEEFFRQCLRLQEIAGQLIVPSVGELQVNELVAFMEGNPNATLTWDQDGDGEPILHDVIADRVKGTEMTVSLKFAHFGDAAPSDHCGPKEVAVTRAIVNGVELGQLDRIFFVAKLMKQTRPE